LKTALAKRDFMAHYQSRSNALMQAELMQSELMQLALQVSADFSAQVNAMPEGDRR
jgi:hypothetical protein